MLRYWDVSRARSVIIMALIGAPLAWVAGYSTHAMFTQSWRAVDITSLNESVRTRTGVETVFNSDRAWVLYSDVMQPETYCVAPIEEFTSQTETTVGCYRVDKTNSSK